PTNQAEVPPPELAPTPPEAPLPPEPAAPGPASWPAGRGAGRRRTLVSWSRRTRAATSAPGWRVAGGWGAGRDRAQAAPPAAGRGDQAPPGPAGEAGLAPDRPPVGAEQLVRGDKSTKGKRATGGAGGPRGG